MSRNVIAAGTVHELPADMRNALVADPAALEKWEDITPLARNEWICWVTFSKKDETRKEHVERLVRELKEGMRRPCCWIGCIHRTDKAVSPSVQGLLDRRSNRDPKQTPNAKAKKPADAAPTNAKGSPDGRGK